jgi:hypothetical protein
VRGRNPPAPGRFDSPQYRSGGTTIIIGEVRRSACGNDAADRGLFQGSIIDDLPAAIRLAASRAIALVFLAANNYRLLVLAAMGAC